MREDVRFVDGVEQVARLRGEVDEVGLVAVDGLDAQGDAAVGGAAGRLFQDAGDGLQLLGLRRLAGKRTQVRIEAAGEHGRAQSCRRLHRAV